MNTMFSFVAALAGLILMLPLFRSWFTALRRARLQFPAVIAPILALIAQVLCSWRTRYQHSRIRSSASFALFLLLLALAFGPPPAMAQFQPNFIVQFTNFTSLVLSSNSALASFTPTNVTKSAVTVKPRNGMAFFVSFQGTNTTLLNTNLLINFETTADGTNWTTTHPYQWSIPLNGTNVVTASTNFPAAAFDNLRFVGPFSASQGSTNGIVVNYLYGSWNNQ